MGEEVILRGFPAPTAAAKVWMGGASVRGLKGLKGCKDREGKGSNLALRRRAAENGADCAGCANSTEVAVGL